MKEGRRGRGGEVFFFKKKSGAQEKGWFFFGKRQGFFVFWEGFFKAVFGLGFLVCFFCFFWCVLGYVCVKWRFPNIDRVRSRYQSVPRKRQADMEDEMRRSKQT